MNDTPKQYDINIFGSLDEIRAVKNFLGKDHDQALQLFNDNFIYYQEDLAEMGKVGFQYYYDDVLRYFSGVSIDADLSGELGYLCGLVDMRIEDMTLFQRRNTKILIECLLNKWCKLDDQNDIDAVVKYRMQKIINIITV